MALTFDFRDVKDYATFTTNPSDPDAWHPVADAIVWLCMICGVQRITEKNLDDTIARFMAYQRVTTPYLRAKCGPVWITPGDVMLFVGVKTNVTPLTKAAWQRKLGDIADEFSKRWVCPQEMSAFELCNKMAKEVA